MKAKLINETVIEGYLYDTDRLSVKVSGEHSKNPGSKFISGTVKIATDNDLTNVISVNYRYVPELTKKGKSNPTFNVLNNIITGKFKTIMSDGPDVATKVRANSSLGLNDFPVDDPNAEGGKNWISVKVNDGGFLEELAFLEPNEEKRNTFKCDMVITSAKLIDLEDEGTEKMILKGYAFNSFTKMALPVEFNTYRQDAISYFNSYEISGSNPLFTRVWGHQISETVVKTFKEDSAFGEPLVRESKSVRKDWAVVGGAAETYEFDNEDFITADELRKAIQDREVYLANEKKRRAEWEATRNSNTASVEISKGEFNF